MRRALFAAAVLAVVLPTALIPHSASARGDIFSVQQADLILREYGIYGDIYLIRGHIYELEVRLGRDARNAKAIRSVAAILRDVTRR